MAIQKRFYDVTAPLEVRVKHLAEAAALTTNDTDRTAFKCGRDWLHVFADHDPDANVRHIARNLLILVNSLEDVRESMHMAGV